MSNMVTVNGRRYLVGLAKGQWLVLDLDTGKQELCHNHQTAVLLAREWNNSYDVDEVNL